MILIRINGVELHQWLLKDLILVYSHMSLVSIFMLLVDALIQI